MFKCRRDADDPLLRAFLDEHHLNLLRWPREGVELGQAFVRRPDGSLIPCVLGDLFSEPLPDITTSAGLAAAPMTAKFSGKVEIGSVLDFLTGIAQLFGAAGAAKLSSAYASATRAQVKVRQVKIDRADVGALSQYLGAVDLQQGQSLFQEGDSIFVVIGVARAKAIEVVAFGKDDRHLKVDVEATGLATASAGLQAEDEGGTSVVYLGRAPLAFGVELLEVVPGDGGPTAWRLDTVRKPVQVRGGQWQPDPTDFKFVGGTDGSAFVDLPSPATGGD